MSASGPKWMLSTLVSECSGTSEPLLREGVWLANSHSQERSVWGRGCFRSLSIFLYNIPPPPTPSSVGTRSRKWGCWTKRVSGREKREAASSLLQGPLTPYPAGQALVHSALAHHTHSSRSLEFNICLSLPHLPLTSPLPSKSQLDCF